MVKNQQPMRGGGVSFIGIWKTSRWSYQSRPVHHTGRTDRVTPNQLRPLTDENSLRWQVWVRTRTFLQKGQTSPVEFKFQRSYSSLDMSGPRPNMSKKHLWNLIKGPDKSGGSDLFWNRSNRSDWCAIPV
jgi:hypothetical protein